MDFYNTNLCDENISGMSGRLVIRLERVEHTWMFALLYGFPDKNDEFIEIEYDCDGIRRPIHFLTRRDARIVRLKLLESLHSITNAGKEGSEWVRCDWYEMEKEVTQS